MMVVYQVRRTDIGQFGRFRHGNETGMFVCEFLRQNDAIGLIEGAKDPSLFYQVAVNYFENHEEFRQWKQSATMDEKKHYLKHNFVPMNCILSNWPN